MINHMGVWGTGGKTSAKREMQHAGSKHTQGSWGSPPGEDRMRGGRGGNNKRGDQHGVERL